MPGRIIGRALSKKYQEQRFKVNREKKALTFEQQDRLKELLAEQRKETKKAYLFLSLWGSHWAYLGRWKTQAVFWCTIGGLFVWWIVDMFVLFEHVNYENNKLAEKLIEQVKRDHK